MNPSPDKGQDLAALALSLSAASAQESLESALDILRETTGAEAAELFLAEPGGRGMVLTCHRGLFQHAFFQITRFNPGEGFPGLILAYQKPLLARSLPEDPRYLRTRVKEKGFHACLSVPLFSPGEIIGSIHLAFRHPDADLDRAFQLLSWASVPLATMLHAGLLHAREVVNAHGLDLDGDLEEGFHDMLGGILQRIVRMGGAQGGTLHLLRSEWKGLAACVREGPNTACRCPVLEAEPFQGCPAVTGGRGVALYGPRKSWPLPCQRSRGLGTVSYCIPLMIGEEAIALIQTIYQGGNLCPPTRELVVLEKAAEGTAGTIRDAWRYLEGWRRTKLQAHQWVQRETHLSSPKDLPSSPGIAQPQPGNGRGATPDLDIRCFGPFELFCRGALIPPDRVTRRKALTLLKALLTYDGRPVPKETLIELLWPEAEPEAGGGRLRVVVHALRR